MFKKLLALSVFTVLTAPAFAVTLEQAKKIANSVEKYSATKGWALSTAIVNEEGNLIYFQRGDGSYSGSEEAAIAKAKSANGFRRPTSAFVQGIKDGRTGLVTVPGIVAIEGGLPIVKGGQHMGAIGVSGAKSTEDEETAKYALDVFLK